MSLPDQRASASSRPGPSGSWILLGIIAAGWVGLATLARQPAVASILWTNRLFGWWVTASAALLVIAYLRWRAHNRPALFFGLALTLGLAMVLAVLELCALFEWTDWRLMVQGWFNRGRVNLAYESGFIHDPALTFRRPPGARWSGVAIGDLERKWLLPPRFPRSVTFAYDAQGYRNPTNVARPEVIMVGDSFVEGWLVSSEETVSSELQRRLGRPVANLGVAGYGPAQELVLLKQELPRLRPRIVVWCVFEGNDLYDDYREERTHSAALRRPLTGAAAERALHRSKDWKERSFIRNLLRGFRQSSDALVPNRIPHYGFLANAAGDAERIDFADYAAIPWSEWVEERWNATAGYLRQGARLCRAEGVELLLCFVPIKFRVYQPAMQFPADSPCRGWKLWPLPERFAALCAEEKVAALDLTPALREHLVSGGGPYFVHDSHWGPAGHVVAAKRIEAELRQRGWLERVNDR